MLCDSMHGFKEHDISTSIYSNTLSVICDSNKVEVDKVSSLIDLCMFIHYDLTLL